MPRPEYPTYTLQNEEIEKMYQMYMEDDIDYVGRPDIQRSVAEERIQRDYPQLYENAGKTAMQQIDAVQ